MIWFDLTGSICWTLRIGATTIGTWGDWSPTFRLGASNVLVPEVFGRSFQKARNFTASSHQNAEFSIWVFTNFPGVIPRTITAGGATPSRTQHQAQAPRCWDPHLGSPQLFSRDCAPDFTPAIRELCLFYALLRATYSIYECVCVLHLFVLHLFVLWCVSVCAGKTPESRQRAAVYRSVNWARTHLLFDAALQPWKRTGTVDMRRQCFTILWTALKLYQTK